MPVEKEKDLPKKPPCTRCGLTAYVKIRPGLPNECIRCHITFD